MKHILHILNIILLFSFVSCKDEVSLMPNDDEPCYTIFVSKPKSSATRASYEEKDDSIAVKWEAGDVLTLTATSSQKSYLFYYRCSIGDVGEFYHYGTIETNGQSGFKQGDSLKFGNATYGGESITQYQKKNNECREYLAASVKGLKFSDITLSNPVSLLPVNNSLLHIQAKSPTTFYGGSMLKITGLDKEYILNLGNDPEVPFVKVGEALDVYVVVPCIIDFVSAGTKLKLYFYAYDKGQQNAIDGDEYHYYIQCVNNVETKNDKVVKIKLPDRPTHAAIQLGLPSGMKWATTNVGATTETEYGDYFAWGSIDGYDINTAHDFNTSGNNDDTWNVPLATLKALGILGADNQLTTERDAAVQTWGTNWRMPSRADFGELRNTTYCTWSKTTVNSVQGFKVTSKTNGKYIFFPFAGFRDGTDKSGQTGKAFYRTTSLSKRGSKWAYGVMMTGSALDHEDGNRYTGLPIRPVLANGASVVSSELEGSLFGEFSIANNKKVKFSKGNLQYQASTQTWRFAEQQYEVRAYENDNISSNYSGWIDLFGWGTSGWNSGANCYQPYSTTGSNANYYVGGAYTNSLNGDYAKADWGYNAIENGGNQTGLWRTLTYSEMKHLLHNRKVNNKKLYTKATLKTGGKYDLPVIVVYPDLLEKPDDVTLEMGYYTDYTKNTITLEQLKVLESWGVVLFPPTGFRDYINDRVVTKQYGWKENDYEQDGLVGAYWLGTASTDKEKALNFRFGNDGNDWIIKDLNLGNGSGGWYRYTGHGVRLVHDVK